MKIITVIATLKGGEGKVEIEGSNKKDHAEYTANVSEDGILIDDDEKISPNRVRLIDSALKELL